MRLGLLGGTFNPVHLGHLVIAEDVRAALNLDEVLWVPAPRPWMKDPEELAPIEARCAMVQLAIQGNPHFKLSRIDIERPGPSYAVDTLHEMRRRQPGAALFYLMGMDALANLPQWQQVEEMLALCQIAVAARPGTDQVAVLAQIHRELPTSKGRIIFAEAGRLDISSTEIRRRAHQGLSLRYRLPDPVAKYIEAHRLYR